MLAFVTSLSFLSMWRQQSAVPALTKLLRNFRKKECAEALLAESCCATLEKGGKR